MDVWVIVETNMAKDHATTPGHTTTENKDQYDMKRVSLLRKHQSKIRKHDINEVGERPHTNNTNPLWRLNVCFIYKKKN